MTELKNSGVSWIGNIPKTWEVCKAKYLMAMPVQTGAGSSAEEYSQEKIRYIRISDFDKQGNIDDSVKASLPKEIGINYLLNDNDILVATAGGTVGKALLFKDLGEPCAYAGYLARYVVDQAKLIPQYLLYYLQSPLFINFRAYAILKATIENISASKYANMEVVVPSIYEQRAIVDLLDFNFAKVNKLIANQEKQIEKLKTYKQSLITEVVTKGLDPTVPMKDSGVEWIGKANYAFDIVTIGSLFEIKKDIIGKEPDQVLSITQNGIKIKDTESNEGQNAASYSHYQIVNVGDFAMNHMDLLTGWIDISKFEGVTSPDYRVFILKDKSMIAKYFLYVFQCYYKNKIFYAFGQGAANMGRWRLPATNFKKVRIPVPPVGEQKVIVEYLDNKCAQIDRLITIKEQKIERLNQYKKSLIYEYVTGKKEVTI